MLGRLIPGAKRCVTACRSFTSPQVPQPPPSNGPPPPHPDPPQSSKAPTFIFLTAGALLGAGTYYYQHSTDTPVPLSTVRLPDNSSIGGPWTLLNAQGQPVTSDAYTGCYTVYYFGYTNCPEICPASLRKMAAAIEILKKKGRVGVKYLFISLDPERDTPEKVGSYAKMFHEEVTGMVVRLADLPQFLKQFKLFSTRMPLPDGGYNLDHTNYMYLMNKSGKLMTVLGYNLTKEELAAKIDEQLHAAEA